MAFTPQQGDYFEISKLTEEQFYKIRAIYAEKVGRICLWEEAKGKRYVGWSFDDNFEPGAGIGKFFGYGVIERLLTYEDVFGEKNMIDWTKPIETTNGNFASFVKEQDGVYSCAVPRCDVSDGDLFICNFNKTGLHISGKVGSISVRNKPETIMLQGWFAFYDDCSFVDGVSLQSLKGTTPNAASYISMKDLLSGKFKDGIPMGYISEEK